MIALGLDPSLRSFGWAVIDTNGKGTSRRIASGHQSTVASDCQPARYMFLQELVRQLLSSYRQIEVVGIESPAYHAGPFQSIHHSLMMFSLAEIFSARKDCVLFDPATREFLVRNGRKGKMGKADIQRYVQLDMTDPSPLQNDEADAYVIALFAARLTEVRNGLRHPDTLSEAEKKKFLFATKKRKTLSGSISVRTGHVLRENNRFFDFSRVPIGSVALPSKRKINPVIEDYLQKYERGDESEIISDCNRSDKCYACHCEPVQWVENRSSSQPVTIAACSTHRVSDEDLKLSHLIDRTQHWKPLV